MRFSTVILAGAFVAVAAAVPVSRSETPSPLDYELADRAQHPETTLHGAMVQVQARDLVGDIVSGIIGKLTSKVGDLVGKDNAA